MSPPVQDYRGRLFAVKDLPTIPSLHGRILKLFEDPNYSIGEAGRLIEMDQVLSSKVLKLVNSPFYGISGNVASVKRAIVLMGSNLIRGLILSASLFDIADKTLPGLWGHSYCASTVAGYLALKLDLTGREDVMTGALLHDIGKVLIRKQLPDESRTIGEAVTAGMVPSYQAEKTVIGIAHDEVGSWLADTWNLPRIIKNVISYHHRPGSCASHATEVAVVHMSDIIVKGLGISHREDKFVPHFDEKGWASLGLSEDDIGDIVVEIIDMMQDDLFFPYLRGKDGR